MAIGFLIFIGADEWDETASFKNSNNRVASPLADILKLLRFRRTNRDHHATSFRQLSKEWRGDFGSGGGNYDRRERGTFWKTECAIASKHAGIGITHTLQDGPCLLRQRFM